MSRFAQLVNAAEARKQADTSPPKVGAHIPKSVDAHIPIVVDAHNSEHIASTTEKSGRPQLKKVGATKKNVGAKASTKTPSVDANASTFNKSGRPRKTKVGAHKSDRHRADLMRQHFRITPELDEQFRIFRAKMNLDLQEFYALAGVHFIEHVGVHTNINVDALASHDDRDVMIKVYLTARIIITLYLRYNFENKWKVSDDQIARKYNDVDIRLIEVAIIRTQFNANFKKINSFKYYVPEIEETLAIPLGDETIKIMLERSRLRWNEAKAKT